VIAGEVGTVPLTDSRKELEARGIAGHFALEVEDVGRAAEALAEGGYPPLGAVITRPDGSASVFVRDPDGNLVELIQPGE
jgi:catechol 2,3-dioxygenase-like lactoylglutathione lyase family enzyme